MAASMAEYHRRLDRGPEKDEFKRLSRDDKQLVSQLRNAMEGTREKMSTLRDEVDNRERDMSREQALRRAAEQRLEQLVDMYGDPGVLRELRERLPRAGTSDPKLQWQAELDEMVRKEQQGQHYSAHSAEGQASDTENSGRRSRSVENRKRGSSSPDTTDGSTRPQGSRRRSHSPPGATHPGGNHPGGNHPGGNQPYPGASYSPYPYYPYPYPPPVAGYPQVFSFPPGFAQPQAGAQAGAPMAQAGAAGATPMMAYFPANQNAQLVNQSAAGLEGAAGASGGGGGAGAMSGATAGAGGASSGSQAAREAATNREQTKQIALLLAELDAAKDLNKKLQTKLHETERELESMKISESTREAQTQAEIASKAADLVEEIYRAQKERDHAMLKRLRIANEERDNAMTQLKAVRDSMDSHEAHPELATDLDLEETLGELEAADAAGVGASGEALVAAITATRRRRRNVSREEMRAVLQERDTAVTKCEKLEAEVVRLQRITRVKGSEQQHHATVQAKLLATQQERDMALAKVRALEDELQTLRLYYSLHKSLSQEANMRDQFHNTLENYEGELKHREQIVSAAAKQNNSLAARLQEAMEERAGMEEKLAKAQAAQAEAQDNQKRTERLVNVLRRKLNGLGAKSED